MIDYKALIYYIENLDEEKVMDLIEYFIECQPTRAEGIEVMNACQKGTEKVGLLYEKGEYFISDLLVAGTLLAAVKEKLEIIIGEEIHTYTSGRIRLDSVFGDEPEKGEIVLAKIVQMAGFVVIKSCAKVS